MRRSWSWRGFQANGFINKVSVEGGAVIPLAPIMSFGLAVGLDWREDGTILYGRGQGPAGLWTIPEDGGDPTEVMPRGDGVAQVLPQTLPGGQAVLFTEMIRDVTGDGQVDPIVAVYRFADGERKTLVRGAGPAAYLPSGDLTRGHLVYHAGGTLFAAPFDLDALEMRGTGGPSPAPAATTLRHTAPNRLALLLQGSQLPMHGICRPATSRKEANRALGDICELHRSAVDARHGRAPALAPLRLKW